MSISLSPSTASVNPVTGIATIPWRVTQGEDSSFGCNWCYRVELIDPFGNVQKRYPSSGFEPIGDTGDSKEGTFSVAVAPATAGNWKIKAYESYACAVWYRCADDNISDTTETYVYVEVLKPGELPTPPWERYAPTLMDQIMENIWLIALAGIGVGVAYVLITKPAAREAVRRYAPRVAEYPRRAVEYVRRR